MSNNHKTACQLFIKNNIFRARLFYQNQSIKRKYLLENSFVHAKLQPSNSSIDEYKYLLWEYFRALQSEWEWKIFEEGFDTYDAKQVFTPMELQTEGLGVTSFEVVLEEGELLHDWLQAVREFSPRAKVRVVDNQQLQRNIANFLTQNSIKSAIVIDTDLWNVGMAVFDYKNMRKTIANIGKLDYDVFQTKFVSQDLDISQVCQSDIVSSFATLNIQSEESCNDWANFYDNPGLVSYSAYTKDILRSMLTAQILSIYNLHEGKFVRFSQESDEKRAIIIQGQGLNLLEQNEILTAIIDGLQIRGIFDIFYDPSFLLGQFAIEVVDGNLSSSLLFVPRGSDWKKEKVAYELSVEVAGDRLKYFGLSDRITTTKISEGATVASFIWKNGFQILGLDRGSINLEDHPYDEIVVDTRRRPVVYSTNFEQNRSNFARWFEAHD